MKNKVSNNQNGATKNNWINIWVKREQQKIIRIIISFNLYRNKELKE